MVSKKRALSTVLTTVIILVSSVVLASGTALFGTSLFQGGAQQESMAPTEIKIWVHSQSQDGLAWGALKLRNMGDKIMSVDTIQVRGMDVPFAQWYPDTSINATTYQHSLNFTGWSGTNGFLANSPGVCGSETLQIKIFSAGEVCANSAKGPVALSSGQATIIYFKMTNGTLSYLDSGATASVNILSGKAGAPQSVIVEGRLP